MALAEATVPIAFSGGIDTKTDSKSVAPTKLVALENGVFDKSTTIVKRTGYDALSKDIDGGGAYEVPAGLAARGDELTLFADDYLFSYRDSVDTWSKVGRCQSIVHTERPIAVTDTDQSMPDGATLRGVTVIAWEDSRGGVWWAIVELASGRMLRAAEQIDANGQKPRVVVCGDRLHVYYAVPSAGRIWVVVVNPSAYLLAPTPVVLVATLSATNPTYDAEIVQNNPPLSAPAGGGSVLAWALDTAGYQVAYIDPSGVLGSAVTGWPPSVSWPDSIDGPIAVTYGDGYPFVAVAYTAGLDVGLRVLEAADLTVSLSTSGVITSVMSLPPVRITATTGYVSESVVLPGLQDIWVWAEEPGADPRDSLVWYGYRSQTGVGDQVDLPLRGHGLASRGFRDDRATCVLVTHEVPFFPYVAILRSLVTDYAVSPVPESVAIGRLLVGSSDGLPERGHLATVEVDVDNERIHRWPGLARQQVNAPASGLQFTETAIEYVTLDFASADAFQHAEFGPDLIVAGAMPWRYDGDTVAEMGFHTAPDGPVVVVKGAGGLLTASSSYLYAFAYEEVDAAGVIHPGGMSIGTLVALGVGETRVTVTIPTYRLTSKRRVRIGVFRSEANDTEAAANGFPDMYRVSSLDPSATGSNGFVNNSVIVDTVTFVDDLSDLLLLTRERSYTNNGVLSNDPVGLGSVVAGGKERLFFSDPTDGQVVRYSQAARDGYGPEVCADLSIAFDQVTGAVTALGILDDKLLVFKAQGLDYVAGPGPLPNPDAAPQIGFSPPQQIPSNVGCAAPRSLATTSDKIMFQASDGRGIYEVDRSCAVNYVGAPVEAYNAIPIVSADAIPGKHRTVFLMATGKSLMYDDYHGQWSTFTNHDGIDGEVVDGRYHYLRANVADYRVFRSSTGYLDAGLSILLYLETAWIKLAGYHQGLQKIWRATLLGKYVSNHVLSLAVATDYRPGFENPYYVYSNNQASEYGEGPYGAGDYGGADDSVFQQRFDVSRKCQAIRFAIGETMGGEFDYEPPVGGSFELTELLLTGGVLRPAVVLGSSRSQ